MPDNLSLKNAIFSLFSLSFALVGKVLMNMNLKQIKKLYRKNTDADISECFSNLATSILMGKVRWCSAADLEDAMKIIVEILGKYANNVSYGDTMCTGFRAFAQILEHIPGSYFVHLQLYPTITGIVSKAIHRALAQEWRHSTTDTSMLLEESLKVLCFIAKYDLNGRTLEHTNPSDLCSLCTFDDYPMVKQGALKTLFTLCNNVILPSELDTGFFVSIRKMLGVSPPPGELKNANAHIVTIIENTIAPFLVNIIEILADSLDTLSDQWSNLAIALSTLGGLIERAFLCHRHSTSRVLVTENLLAILIRLIIKTNESVVLNKETRASRILLCETVLCSAALAHRELVSQILLEQEAVKFFDALLNPSLISTSAVLDDPFDSASSSPSPREKAFDPDLVIIAGLNLLNIVSSNIPSYALGNNPHFLHAIHEWKCENEFHEKNTFSEGQCSQLECAYNRLETTFMLNLGRRKESVNLKNNTVRRTSKKIYNIIERAYVPFKFEFVPLESVRPVAPVKEGGPEAQRASKNRSSPMSTDELAENVQISEVTLCVAELYFEKLCVFLSNTFESISREVAVRSCAGMLYALLMGTDKGRAKKVVEKSMLSLCTIIDEGLFGHKSSAPFSSVEFAMVKWLLKKEEHLCDFSVMFDRWGMRRKLASLCNREMLLSGEKDTFTKRIAVQLDELISINLQHKEKNSFSESMELQKLGLCIVNVKKYAKVPGLHSEKLEEMLQAMSSNALITAYEALEMQLAHVLLLYLLDGKKLSEFLGPSVIYATEGYGSSGKQGPDTVKSNLSVVDEDELSMLGHAASKENTFYQQFNQKRAQEFTRLGMKYRSGFEKLIRLLCSSLLIDLQLPLVESFATSEPVRCKTPLDAFIGMNDSYLSVSLCSKEKMSIEEESMRSTLRSIESRNFFNDHQPLPRQDATNPGKVAKRKNDASGEHNLSHSSTSCEIESGIMRAHLLSSIGDIERLLRTGCASTKGAFPAPAAQCSLANTHLFVRVVEIYLKETCIDSANSLDGVVARKVLKLAEKQNWLLPTLTHLALSRFAANGKLESSMENIPAPQSQIEERLSKEEICIVSGMVMNALEWRFSLFRPLSGLCHLQETFFSILFREAVQCKKKKKLLYLERMLCHERGKQKVYYSPLPTSDSTSYCSSPSLTRPSSPSQNENPMLNDKQSPVAHPASYIFHYFDSSECSRCHCGNYDISHFSAQSGDGLFTRHPPLAYKEELAVLVILHEALYAENRRGSTDIDPSVFASSQLSVLVVKSAAKSALRVALLPAKYALPRWVNFIFLTAKFLIPLKTREKLCRFIAFGAKKSFFSALNAQKRYVRGWETVVSQLSRSSNRKFSVDRKNLLLDSFKVLRKAADCPFPVMMEFMGDAGVGAGPTAQFYTLLAYEVCRKSLHLWNRSTRSNESDLFVLPPSEGLYPAVHRCQLQDKRKVVENRVILYDRVVKRSKDFHVRRDKMVSAYYTVGLALGRAFIDGHVFPLHLSAALFMFLQVGLPPATITVSEDVAHEAVAPIDLFSLNLEHAKMVDEVKIKSISKLFSANDDALRSLEIPFTLPDDDEFKLIANGSTVYVTGSNSKLFEKRFISAMLYESVAAPLRMICAGFFDVICPDALLTLNTREVAQLLSGESREKTEPLWTYDDIRAILVGDHGYSNDSLQLDMLAEVLCKRFTPAEQRNFMFFLTGCPRLPLGGVRALGAITVVKRTDNFFSDSLEELENSGLASSQSCSELSAGKRRSLREKEWALPSVNTCFRYLKLPPYPTVELMYKKLLLSIRQTGDTFELS